jgi:hypothetical protein
MASEIMGTDFKTDFSAGPFNNLPGAGIADGENPFFRRHVPGPDIFPQPGCHLLGDINDLVLPTAFGPDQKQFAVIHIRHPKLQDLSDTHTTSGHQFEHQTVSRIIGSENDFVNSILFQDDSLAALGMTKCLFQDCGFARVNK